MSLKKFDCSTSCSISSLLEDINDILLELKDDGFQTITNHKIGFNSSSYSYDKDLRVVPSSVSITVIILDGDYKLNSDLSHTTVDVANLACLTINKLDGFIFEDISEVVWRIKDLVGISGIKSVNYSGYKYLFQETEFDKIDLRDLDNESIVFSSKISNFFIMFNFTI